MAGYVVLGTMTVYDGESMGESTHEFHRVFHSKGALEEYLKGKTGSGRGMRPYTYSLSVYELGPRVPIKTVTVPVPALVTGMRRLAEPTA